MTRCGLMDILQLPNRECQTVQCVSNSCTDPGCQIRHSNPFSSHRRSNVHVDTERVKYHQLPKTYALTGRTAHQNYNHIERNNDEVNGYRPEIPKTRNNDVSDQPWFLPFSSDQSTHHGLRGMGTQGLQGRAGNRKYTRGPTQNHYNGFREEDSFPTISHSSILVNPYDDQNLYHRSGMRNMLSNPMNHKKSQVRVADRIGYLPKRAQSIRSSNDQQANRKVDVRNYQPLHERKLKLRSNRYSKQKSQICGNRNCYPSQSKIKNGNQQTHECFGRRCSLLHRITEIQSSPCFERSCQSGQHVQFKQTIKRHKTCVLPFCDLRNPFHNVDSIVSTADDCRKCNSGNCISATCSDNMRRVCQSARCKQTADPQRKPNGNCRSGSCGEETVVIDEPCKQGEVFVEDENGFR